MKYGEVFSEEFIKQLNELSESTEEPLQLNSEIEDGFIDIEDILKKLNFKIERKDGISYSGKLDNNNEITINNEDVATRQRFTMAHELGHAVNGQVSAQRVGHADAYSIDEQKNEIFANKFAAQFLMPKKLLIRYIDEYILEKEYDSDKLSKDNVEEIIDYLSNKLVVSRVSMEYRIKNLNVFLPTEDDI